MFTYWMMFLFPAVAALSRPNPRFAGRRGLNGPWTLVWLALTLIIGFRHSVGGDWGNYLRRYNQWYYYSWTDAFAVGDPGYFLLNWLSVQMGWGIYGVNLLAGALFVTGLIVFCRHQPRPWLALLVAIPYLVIVVGMGYTRQAIAIGFGMLALVALSNGNNTKFVAWILVGTLFHKSAIVLLPLSIFVARSGRWWTAIWVGATAILVYYVWVADTMDQYIRTYMDGEWDSRGAAIRAVMNAIPAVIFLLSYRHLSLDTGTKRTWLWMSGGALAMVAALIVLPSSTAVDRIGLFLIPLQLFVFSRVPDLIRGNREFRQLIILGTIAYAGFTQAVWLNFANHAHRWVPYQFYPLSW
jgi:hypothetical protein